LFFIKSSKRSKRLKRLNAKGRRNIGVFTLLFLDIVEFISYTYPIMEERKYYNKVMEDLRNLIAHNHYNRALKVYLNNISDFKDKADLRNLGGDILLKLGKEQEAIREYERCVELYREKCMYANAIAICKKVLRVVPDFDFVYSVLGNVYMETGLVGEAALNYLRYADILQKKNDIEELGNVFDSIISIFGERNKILLQNFAMFPDLKEKFDSYLKKQETIKEVQEKDLIESIKRDAEYEMFNKLVEMELYRSRRFVRPFSIFAIELKFLNSSDEDYLPDVEKLFGIIKNNLRTIDYIFLNEKGFFYGLLPETPSDGVFVLSDRLVNRIKNLMEQRVKVSMRWATYPKDGKQLNELLESMKSGGQVYFQ
jgi:tetratricopeptide (TPR) repeat protein